MFLQVGDRGFLGIIVVEPLAKLGRSGDFLIALPKTTRSRIQSKTLLPRLGLNDIGALPAEGFVPSQDIGYLSGGAPLEEDRECDAIFDRLIGTLPYMGKHRLGCVAQ